MNLRILRLLFRTKYAEKEMKDIKKSIEEFGYDKFNSENIRSFHEAGVPAEELMNIFKNIYPDFGRILDQVISDMGIGQPKVKALDMIEKKPNIFK
jgi:hypothetical protein